MSKVFLYSPSGQLISSTKDFSKTLQQVFNFDGFLTIKMRERIEKYYKKPFAKGIKLISYRYDYEGRFPTCIVCRKLSFK